MFKVIETFSGIGSQAKALDNIGVEHEIVKTAEWDINAIIAYCLIHKGEIDTERYKDISDGDIVKNLKKYQLSSDGKKAMNEQSFKRVPMHVKRQIFAAIKQTNNMVSITDVRGVDIPEDIDLFTYSFPCQDLSLCGCWHGNKSGISRDAQNRSGMLWEVERILLEMFNGNRRLPRFLLMENVTNILSKTHKEDFDSWKKTLEEMGYINKIYRLNSKNFGIPQKRERAYMISILCEENEEIKQQVWDYFDEYNLENNDAERLRRRHLNLQDILRLDYTDYRYKNEADSSNPNNTPSRRDIWNDNDKLVDEDGFHEIIVNTVTTKQDRNPNSGVILYRNHKKGKAKFRYLTSRECFLLMGFEEEDYQKLIDNNPRMTKSRNLYSTEKMIKLAGNSIVVDVLEAIFKQIIEIDMGIFGVNHDGDEL